jgi:hypothetical protein
MLSPALAVDLTVDQTQPILSADGTTQKWVCGEWTGGDKPPCLHKDMMTLGSVIQDVLVTPLSDPSGRTADPNNAKAGSLAIRVYGKDKYVMSLDDIKLIMDRARRLVTDPIALARMEQYLEPPATTEEKKP